MASMASSMSLPMSGFLAAAWSLAQRATSGTQKTLAEMYSSRSSSVARFCLRVGDVVVALGVVAEASSLARRLSKASEMYLRKMSPRTTCLYSAASRFPRSLSAASQSFSSKPRLAPLPLPLSFFVAALRLAIKPSAEFVASLGGVSKIGPILSSEADFEQRQSDGRVT
jgi:hypothetical protein